jgi:hypothetical protein
MCQVSLSISQDGKGIFKKDHPPATGTKPFPDNPKKTEGTLNEKKPPSPKERIRLQDR